MSDYAKHEEATRANVEAARARDGHTQRRLPTRIGIALVDHDDNVLENGPYFSLQTELERVLEQPAHEPLLVPLLKQYAQRTGIHGQEPSVAATDRSSLFTPGDVVVLRDGDAELPRLAVIESQTWTGQHGDVLAYLVEELDCHGLSEEIRVRESQVERLATAAEVVAHYQRDPEVDEVEPQLEGLPLINRHFNELHLELRVQQARCQATANDTASLEWVAQRIDSLHHEFAILMQL